MLIQSLNKMQMKYVLYCKFRMIIFHDQKDLLLNFKSSHLQMFFIIDVLKNLAMFIGKHLCWSWFLLLFNIVAGLEDRSCIKKRLQHKCFLVNIAKFLRTPILKNICERQLLYLLLIIQLLIKYSAAADLFLIKNLTWNGSYYEGL